MGNYERKNNAPALDASREIADSKALEAACAATVWIGALIAASGVALSTIEPISGGSLILKGIAVVSKGMVVGHSVSGVVMGHGIATEAVAGGVWGTVRALRGNVLGKL
ncbi:hypothetical protein HY090_00280 [Candidatus Kaiserbacteria bacterium]|nr:hypothetical protein [Candidatus Kaiserbacteria bacterium]